MTSLRAQIFNAETRGVVGFADSLDALGTFEFLFRNELIGRIDKLISEQADSSGLSDEESGRQTGEASTKRLSTERIVCALIEKAVAEWLPADYTHELGPLAILSVVQTGKTPAARPGSSPGYSWLLMRP